MDQKSSGHPDPRKRILLRGAMNQFNFGDDLILFSLCEFMNKVCGISASDAIFYVSRNAGSFFKMRYSAPIHLEIIDDQLVSHSVQNEASRTSAVGRIWFAIKMALRLLCPDRSAGKIIRLLFHATALFFEALIFRLIGITFHYRRLFDFYKSLDVIYYVGGGYLVSRWRNVLVREWLLVTAAKLANPCLKVIGTGLGLGPMVGKKDKVLLKLMLSQFSFIAVRERKSLELLDQLRVNTVKKLLGDDVILLHPFFEEIKRKNATCGKMAAMNLKHFIDHDYNLVRGVMQQGIDHLRSKNYTIEIFEFGQVPGPDDQSVVNQLGFLCDAVHNPYKKGCESFLNHLARASMGVGFAYHFAIVMILLGKPLTSIYMGDYYEQKIKYGAEYFYQIPALSTKEFAKLDVKEWGSMPICSSDELRSLYQKMANEYQTLFRNFS